MQRVKDFFEQGTVVPFMLGASALIGLAAIVGVAVLPNMASPQAEMYITPDRKTVLLNEPFAIEVRVRSVVPVNVFAGELVFDSEVLQVTSIDYNVSVADLWAERPWFSDGDGTLNFVGGSLQEGGFMGEEGLITVHFRPVREGSGRLALRDAHILRHDGLGSEVALGTPIENVVIVSGPEATEGDLIARVDKGSEFTVLTSPPSTDLNGDGRQTIADVSIFMLNIAGNDPRYDFNQDGRVNTTDLNLLLSTE